VSELQPYQRRSPTTYQQSASLRDVIFVLFRRRWIILAISVPIMVIASLGLFKRTGVYVAATKLLIELQTPEITQWNTSGAHVDYDRTLSTYQHMVMSVPVTSKAAQSLEDSLDAVIKDHPEFAPLRNPKQFSQFLHDHLDASQLGESSILKIEFGCADPRLSLMGVRACRDAFLDYAIQATKNARALGYYEEQINMVRSAMDSLLAKRAAIMQKSGYSDFKEDIKHDTGQRAKLRDEYYEAVANREFLERRLAFMKRARAEHPEHFPLDNDRSSGQNTMLLATKTLIAGYYDDLNRMRTEFPEESPKVQRQLQLIAETRALLLDAIDDYITAYESDIDALRQREETLLAQIDGLEKTIDEVPGVYQHVSLIDMELQAKNKLIEDLQIKAGEVRLNAMADERVSRIIKLTDPEIERVVTGGRMLAYFVLVSLFGFLFSIVVAFAVDRQDHKIYHPSNIEQYLEVPVLGVVTDAKRQIR
jgi:uncharacterized protein involved in exopolysaccharide biosynthesis